MRVHTQQHGFTLIEVVIVLVLFGILSSTATLKYVDIQDSAEKQAAKASVAEAQIRIQQIFGQQLLQGKSCDEAVPSIQDLAQLGDDDGRFGGFYLMAEGPISPAGTGVFAKRGENGTFFDTEAKLYAPLCGGQDVTSGTALINKAISDVIIFLIATGNDSREDWGDYAGPYVMGNGVSASLKVEHGKKGDYGKVSVVFSNENGEKMNFQFTQRADGSATIHEVQFWSDDKRTQIVHSISATRDQATLNAAKAIAQNLGLNVSGISAVFDASYPSSVIEIASGQFSF